MTLKYGYSLSFIPPGFLLLPPRSGLLMPGVFKPSCSTPFTLFLHLVSIYQSFQLYFIPKTLHDTSIFSSLLTTYFYLTGHSPVSIYNTALLYIVLALCGHLQTQHFAVRCIPCRGRMGSWCPGLPLDGWLGWPNPIGRLVVLCPNFK